MSEQKYILDGVDKKMYVYDNEIVFKAKSILDCILCGFPNRYSVPIDSIGGVRLQRGSKWVNGFLHLELIDDEEWQKRVFARNEEDGEIKFSTRSEKLRTEGKNAIEAFALANKKTSITISEKLNEQAEEIKTYIERRISYRAEERPYVKQNTSSDSVGHATILQTSVADEILKFKKMLDDGIIADEEFNAIKKKLLEL